jgi:hypothetical protein
VSRWRSHSSLLWRLVSVVGVVAVTYVAFYYQFRPNLEIMPPAPTAQAGTLLFSNPFIIRNNSVLFSIANVRARCHTGQVRLADGSSFENNTIADYQPTIAKLEAGEQASVPCDLGADPDRPILRAEVALQLHYSRPWFFLGRTEVHQGFVAIIGENGKAFWTSVPTASIMQEPLPPE